MYRKFPETNNLAITEKNSRDFLVFFSCRFHTVAYWLAFNSEILILLSHDKLTNDYDFMIDFMYIIAPPSPLHTAYLNVCDFYFVKYMCFF